MSETKPKASQDAGRSGDEVSRHTATKSHEFSENRGITMDTSYPITPVSSLPAEPATPPPPNPASAEGE